MCFTDRSIFSLFFYNRCDGHFALDLGMLGDQLPGAAVIEVVHDGLALDVEAEARFPLLVRGHSVIGDKPAEMRAHCALFLLVLWLMLGHGEASGGVAEIKNAQQD